MQARELTKPLQKRALKRPRPYVLPLPTDTDADTVKSFGKAERWLLEELEKLKVYTQIHKWRAILVKACSCM